MISVLGEYGTGITSVHEIHGSVDASVQEECNNYFLVFTKNMMNLKEAFNKNTVQL